MALKNDVDPVTGKELPMLTLVVYCHANKQQVTVRRRLPQSTQHEEDFLRLKLRLLKIRVMGVAAEKLGYTTDRRYSAILKTRDGTPLRKWSTKDKIWTS